MSEERKRAAAIENKLKQTEARLAEVEAQAQKYATELARPRQHEERAPTAHDLKQACAALSQAANDRLGGRVPTAGQVPSSGQAGQAGQLGQLPQAPSAFLDASTDAFRQAEAEADEELAAAAPPPASAQAAGAKAVDLLGLMDQHVPLPSPMRPNMGTSVAPLPQPFPQPFTFTAQSFPQPAPLPPASAAAGVVAYSEPYPSHGHALSSTPRKSPRLIESLSGASRPSATPKSNSRWTPNPLMPSAAKSDRKKGKVQFAFPSKAGASAGTDENERFPTFELPPDPPLPPAQPSSAAPPPPRPRVGATGLSSGPARRLGGGAQRVMTRRTSSVGVGIGKRAGGRPSIGGVPTMLGVKPTDVKRVKASMWR